MSQEPAISNENETKVLAALDNSQWSWRTLTGIAEDTKLPESLITSILEKNKDKIRMGLSESQGLIYQLKDRSNAPAESLKERALDYLSMGRRKIA
jgi:hypothetical protein